MGHIVILEAAQNVSDRVDLANIRKELIAETLALGCAPDKSRDINEGQPRWDSRLRFGNARDLVERLIRHRTLADMRLDGEKGIVRGFGCGCLRERIEKCGLANVRQSDNTAFKAHERFGA